MEKIALIGKNGSDKTTLIKMLLVEEIFNGCICKSKNLKMDYLPQNAFNIKFSQSIVEFDN